MVHSRGNVAIGVLDRKQGRKPCRKGLSRELFGSPIWNLSCTFLLLLSILLMPAPVLAQSSGAGGALGDLLEQLQTLQGTGAIDALEGRARRAPEKFQRYKTKPTSTRPAAPLY